MSTPSPLPAGRRLGPYEILGFVGSGGMSEVYRARDPRLGRDAMKRHSAVRAICQAARACRIERPFRARRESSS